MFVIVLVAVPKSVKRIESPLRWGVIGFEKSEMPFSDRVRIVSQRFQVLRQKLFVQRQTGGMSFQKHVVLATCRRR